MEDPKQQLLAKLRDSTNVLVTVTSNPSVDQLAGAIGFTLMLNKLGKHATAVFSGKTPDVLEFLKPEATLEKNTDSLRDFIIALDKAKADKLRYKVEDTFVKIFITPYHTALTDKDLEFSQGDYNVDLVVAIGAHQPADLDQAITSHGRILHDAVVSSINNGTAGNLGTINWVDPKASSLCEMIFDLIQQLQPENGLDGQMATALLTGIVSETRRFGNDKTTAKALETSSLLVAAGANQQLVAAKLEEHPAPIPEKKTVTEPVAQDDPNAPGAINTHQDPEAVPQTSGTVSINHDDDKPADTTPGEIHIDEEGKLHEDIQPAASVEETSTPPETGSALEDTGPKFIADAPAIGNDSFAAPSPDAIVDPLSETAVDTASSIPLLSHDSGPALRDSSAMLPSPVTATDDSANKTLADIEKSVDSPHNEVVDDQPPALDAARDAVMNANPEPLLQPQESLNAQTVDLDTPFPLSTLTDEPAPVDGLPSMSFTAPPPATDNTASPIEDPSSPPPVPPPMMPPSFANASSQEDGNRLQNRTDSQ